MKFTVVLLESSPHDLVLMHSQLSCQVLDARCPAFYAFFAMFPHGDTEVSNS